MSVEVALAQRTGHDARDFRRFSGNPLRASSVVRRALPWRSLIALIGPGYLIAVGYMDPGNWATDLAGGSGFGYALLPVVIGASLAAMLLQYLALKLGAVTGKSLAELCREHFPRPLVIPMWLAAEGMIIACDLAEVIGTAIALNLLFGLPLLAGVMITAADTLLFLMLQRRGLRTLEALVMVAVISVVGCFVAELFLARPDGLALVRGMAGSRDLFHSNEMLYLAIGIVGATIMPHNLYLHSEIAKRHRSRRSIGELVRGLTLDSTLSLSLAAFVNCAILILAATVFFVAGQHNVADISQAYHLLSPALGGGLAAALFAVALLLSGQTSTITATMAGESIMQGFLGLRARPWLRRLITRSLAIIPAVFVISLYGQNSIGKLLVGSQVILSLQLPLALIPLIWLTRKLSVMSGHRIGRATWAAAVVICGVILGANTAIISSIML